METSVESMEGSGIPNSSGQQFAEVQPEDIQFIDDNVIKNQNEQTNVSFMDTQNYNSTSDIHEEINRKLEEIANLDNAEELNKADELICDSAINQINMVTQVSDVTDQPNDISLEADAPVSCVEPEALSEGQQFETGDLENQKQQEVESIIPSDVQEDVSISVAEVETDIEMVNQAEPAEGTTGDDAANLLDEQQSESLVNQVENISEPSIDPMELVEDQIKSLVGCESDGPNESTESIESVETVEQEYKVEFTETIIQDTENASVVLTSEQIEITEVESTELIDNEEVQLEYTVVDECEAPADGGQSVSDVQEPAQGESSETKHGADEIKPEDDTDNATQIVYIEESEPLEETTVPDDTDLPVASDTKEVPATPVEEPVKPKKPRGRKPSYALPSHVIGVDINKPSSNQAGRLKPRLGVKVPYRNLASQIVSKKEIEDEIMNRFRQKQAQQAAEKSDIIFARKLTQRLASKIVPEAAAGTSVSLAQTVAKVQQNTSSSIKLPVSSARIEKDSDLLAILEGDDDDLHAVDEETVKKEREEAERKVKMMEREIALKQLRDLPNTPAIVVKSPRVKSDSKVNSDNAKSSRSSSNAAQTASSMSARLKQKMDSSHATKKDDVEPQLKPTMVLKTYSRKRKSLDLDAILSAKKPATSNSKSESIEANNVEKQDEPKQDKKLAAPTEKKASNVPEQKPDAATPAHPYITKSSRVIKKKVIWDPDEVVTPRSLIKSPKPGDIPGTTPKQATPVPKSTDKKPAPDKTVDKKAVADKVDKKVIAEKKSDEKKPIEKKQVASEKIEKIEKKMPKKSISSPKKGKRLSEIDKLLMDEGAVNMLYEVKNTEDAQSKMKKKAKTVISIEKAEKELRNKASELLKDLKQNTTTEDVHKTLRRKEPEVKKDQPTVMLRKMSKDSSRSSVHSPPASPAAFPYEASRLIRRHSSSSFSSVDDGVSDGGDKISKKRSAASGATPKAKKAKKSGEAVATPKVNLVRDTFVLPKEAPPTAVPKQKETSEESTPAPPKMTAVKRTDKIVTIKLNNGEGEAYLSVQILKEVIATLNRLAKDSNCHGVIITSGSNAYCLGLNYKFLVADTEEARKKKATEMAHQVRDFLKCLLNFPKVLIAGIQGDCIGLGVTMLSLFDMVIASDKAQFSMPYGTFGCMPEAAFLLTVPHLIGHGLASELFYTSCKLSASEVARHGLVTRLCWPEKYSDELKTIGSNISQQSLESIQAAKKQLRQNLIQTTEAAITSQTKTLIEHWISDECQNNFANYKLETI